MVGWEKSRVLVDGGCGARNSCVEVGGVRGEDFYGKRKALRIEYSEVGDRKFKNIQFSVP